MADLSTAGRGSWGRAAFWPVGARWRGLAWLLVIFSAYLGAVTLYPLLEAGGVALLWLPNAVLVTALLRFRPTDWVYIYAVALVAEVVGDLTFDVAPHQAVYFGVINAVEASLFVALAALFAGGRGKVGLLSVRGAVTLVLAAVLVPAATGSLGAIGSVWTFDADYLTAWRNWWFGDSLGLLAGVPLGLLLRDTVSSVALRRSRPLAWAGGGPAVLVAVSAGILAANGNAWAAQQTAIGAAVLLALTFGAVGAPMAAGLTTVVTLVGAARGDEGFDSVARDQILLFVVFAAIYAIAATTESADRAMALVSRARDDLEIANQQLSSKHAELLDAHRKLERLARFDTLTGMVNRSEVLARLQSALRRRRTPGSELGVLFCDIDNFKGVNDTWGHATGDFVLSLVTQRIRECLRDSDTIGRLGGDEILVLVPAVHSLDEVRMVAEKIRANVDQPVYRSGKSFGVTLSIGATLAVTGESAATLIARVDSAMYQAKQEGRNRVTCVDRPSAPSNQPESGARVVPTRGTAG